jgi:hypothetical protein
VTLLARLTILRVTISIRGISSGRSDELLAPFDPPSLQICVILSHFSQYEKFWKAVAGDGFFQVFPTSLPPPLTIPPQDKDQKVPLEKAVVTARRLALLPEQEVPDLS